MYWPQSCPCSGSNSSSLPKDPILVAKKIKTEFGSGETWDYSVQEVRVSMCSGNPFSPLICLRKTELPPINCVTKTTACLHPQLNHSFQSLCFNSRGRSDHCFACFPSPPHSTLFLPVLLKCKHCRDLAVNETFIGGLIICFFRPCMTSLVD